MNDTSSTGSSYASAVASYRDESGIQFVSNESRMHHAMLKKVSRGYQFMPLIMCPSSGI